MKKRNGILLLACSLLMLNVACGGASLDGSWAGACVSQGDNSYSKIVYVFADKTLSRETRSFADAACATGLSVTASKFNINAGDSVDAPAGAKALDMLGSGLTIKPLNAAAAAGFNVASLCGFTDWAANVEKDVVGKTCSEVEMSKPSDNYTVYKIDGDNVSFGKKAGSTDDGSTAEKRYTGLSTTVYAKVNE